MSSPDTPAYGSALIQALQSRITEVLDPYCPDSDAFALIDTPNYANVGDSAIWLGNLAYFHGVHGVMPRYVCIHDTFREAELREAVPEGPILLHGGGNFGDLWLPHQQFRELILERFRDRRVIQLPQSIHFDNPDNLKRVAEIIRRHPDFILFVRDQPSLELAQAHFDCQTILCPDMAFYMGALRKPVAPTRPLLLMLRTDKETIFSDNMLDLPYPCEDWLDEPADLKTRLRRRTMCEVLPVLGLKAFDRYRRRELFYRRGAEHRVRHGIRQLSSAEFVITDRLHVHIISLLLGIAHIYLDNSYGKIGHFAQAWTQSHPLAHRAESVQEAIELYQMLRRQQDALRAQAS